MENGNSKIKQETFCKQYKTLKKTLALRLKELVCNFLWLNDFGNFQDIIKKSIIKLHKPFVKIKIFWLLKGHFIILL